jgi:hypothetical protein
VGETSLSNFRGRNHCILISLSLTLDTPGPLLEKDIQIAFLIFIMLISMSSTNIFQDCDDYVDILRHENQTFVESFYNITALSGEI